MRPSPCPSRSRSPRTDGCVPMKGRERTAADAAGTAADVRRRLADTQRVMAREGLQAVIILNADPHKTEYTPATWKLRQHLSGFTGSNGTLVVAGSRAGLWTDFRYYIQAGIELAGSGITLFKSGVPSTPTFLGWLCATLEPGATIGFDPLTVAMKEFRDWRKECDEAGIDLRPVPGLVAMLWPDRPAAPCRPVVDHPVAYAGQSCRAKLTRIRQAMAGKRCDAHLITPLYDIAWLFNLRGDDTPCTPIFMSFALIERTRARLFVDPRQVSASLQRRLGRDGVRLCPYDALADALAALPASSRILLNPEQVPVGLHQALPTGIAITEDAPLPSTCSKAVKNPVEIRHLRQAMVQDAVAMTRFFRWLDERLAAGVPTDEHGCCLQLDVLRAALPGNRGPSFPSIVGYNANAALCHYKPQPTGSARIRPRGLLLVDSGGQYLGGTADTTRTVAVGPVTARMRRDFTLVLKGHIALSRAVFPATARGYQLDILARRAMWESCIDYDHGTGHGVGSYLNVHEGPQSIAHGATPSPARLEPGMVVTNEPGIYREGAHGIRTENMLLVVPHRDSPFARFLRFETLTRCPYDWSLVEAELLDQDEIAWIDDLHRRCYRDQAPFLDAQERAWLRGKTRAFRSGTAMR